MRLIEREAIPRRNCVVFFIIQTSGGMHGMMVESINQAMNEALCDLKALQNEYPDAQIQIAVLRFSSCAEWCLLPTDVENAEWASLYADGLNCFGAVCDSLNSKLSRVEFMNSPSGYYAPIIIPVVKGEPCDDYQRSIERLRNNKWFDSALKAAVLLSDYGDETEDEIYDDWLTHFTGAKEAVLKVETPNMLGGHFSSKLIKSIRVALKASVRASMGKAVDYRRY